MDFTSRNDFTSASAQSSTSTLAQDRMEEQFERVLIEATETLNKLLADVTEMQVECVQREKELSRMYNPSVLEEAREVLNSDDACCRLDEMFNADSTV